MRKVSNGVTAVKIMKRLCASSSSSLIVKCGSGTSTVSTGPGSNSPDSRYTFGVAPSRFFSRENSIACGSLKSRAMKGKVGKIRDVEMESELDKENGKERDRKEKDKERTSVED